MSFLLDCACPLPTALTPITAVDCGIKIEQLVRFGFQRMATTSVFPEATLPPEELASWTAAKALTDGGKVVTSPLFSNAVVPASEAQEEGGNDNTTVNGIPVYLGEGIVQVTGTFRNLPLAIRDELKLLSCESNASASGIPLLGVYAFNRQGNLFSKLDGSGDILPIGIYNFRISTRGTEGYNQDDKLNFSFYLDDDWDSGLTEHKASTFDFNPLTQL